MVLPYMRTVLFLGLHAVMLYVDEVSGIGIIEFPFSGYEVSCPTSESVWIDGPQIAWGVPYRAYKTIPPGMMLKPSIIPEAGDGIFSTTFLRAYTWLAEYEGEIWVDPPDNTRPDISTYAWDMFRGGDRTYYVDALRIETSNWVRWVNCARTRAEENVFGVYCAGKVFYLTTKDVYPGQELLVYYGKTYAKWLGIDWTQWTDR